MKVLYESVIAAEQRHRLGEYYTPDWLAQRVVAEVVTDPLDTRVLDPACGSGTFLFHAVRRYLAAAEAAGMSNAEALAGVCRCVSGIDVHPVAAAFARVTYLLAIGMERIAAPDRPAFSVPVYLGDSIQWNQQTDLLSTEVLTIDTSTSEATLFSEPLLFPRTLLDDPSRFDHLIDEIANRASNRKPGSAVPSLAAVFRRYAVSPGDAEVLTATFATMCRLHDDGRNHIWGYFTRNLARPAWFARPENQVDVLVGNPPWLAYRYMPSTPTGLAFSQETFKESAKLRRLAAAGGESVTHMDLSGLFVARSAELYLRDGGRFGFVMPLAVLSRKHFAGFRTGYWPLDSGATHVAFDVPWDLHGVKPSIFPVPPAVIFGTRGTQHRELPDEKLTFSGRLPIHNASWDEAAAVLTIGEATGPAARSGDRSPYAERFAQGATVLPRLLFMVESAPASPLGVGAGRRAVRSRRSVNEKMPWKDLESLAGHVETQFVFPVHAGETMLSFRLQEPFEAVIPWDGTRLLDVDDDRLEDYPGLASWWRQASTLWDDNRSSGKLTLLGQLDYRRKFSQQFPAAQHRVLYTKGGMYLAAARIDDPRVVIDHKLYWAAATGIDEARYVTAVLNADVFTLAVRGFQSRGEHNPRDFDKYPFELPIPLFDATDPTHVELAEAAAYAETVAEAVELPAKSFQTQRRHIRNALTGDGVGGVLDGLVSSLLGLRAE